MYKKTILKEQQESNSLLFWCITLFLYLFLFFAPFYKALFNGATIDFEPPIYTNWFWSAVCLLLLSMLLFKNWRLNWTGILSIFVLIIPISFWISYFFAASKFLAKNMFFINCLYISFFLIALYFSRSSFSRRTIITGLMLSGYTVVIFGLTTVLGNLHYNHSTMITEYGFRLTSVFQYANAYAAYLIALLFTTLYLIISSENKILKFLFSLMLLPIILSIILTFSRGGFVLLPIILLAIILLIPLNKQIKYFVYLIVGLLTTLIVSNKIIEIANPIAKFINDSTSPSNPSPTISLLEHQSWLGWIYIGVASIITAIIVMLLEWIFFKYIEKSILNIEQKKLSNLVIPCLLILVCGIGILVFSNSKINDLLPTALKERITSINFNQNSFLERMTFYKDAVKLIKDYPILGAGGGAWSTLYEKYQNNPYTSRQAHNFFLQYISEVGILGFSFFLIFLLFIFYNYISKFRYTEENKDSFVFYIFAISLLVHSMIDFEMSYVYLTAIFFICIGGIASFVSEKLKPIKFQLSAKYNKAYPIIICLFSIYFIIISITNLKANSVYETSLSMFNEKKPLQEALVPLDQSISLTSNPTYMLTKLNIMNQVYSQSKDSAFLKEAEKIINSLDKNEPYSRALFMEKVVYYKNLNDYDKVIEVTLQAIQNYPWDITVYEQAIGLLTQYGNNAREEKNHTKKEEYWKKAFDILNIVENKTTELKKLPKDQLEGRPFYVTPSIVLNIGQIYYMQGKYSDASAFLKRRIFDEFFEPADPAIARWYLAALRKQNKDDQGLFERLIKKDPQEKNELEQILQYNFNN